MRHTRRVLPNGQDGVRSRLGRHQGQGDSADRHKKGYQALFRLCEGLRKVAGLLLAQRKEQVARIRNLKEP